MYDYTCPYPFNSASVVLLVLDLLPELSQGVKPVLEISDSMLRFDANLSIR